MVWRNSKKFETKLFYIIKAISDYCGCECYAMYCDTNNESDPYRKLNTKMLETLLEDYVGDDFECFKHEILKDLGNAHAIILQFAYKPRNL